MSKFSNEIVFFEWMYLIYFSGAGNLLSIAIPRAPPCPTLTAGFPLQSGLWMTVIYKIGPEIITSSKHSHIKETQTFLVLFQTKIITDIIFRIRGTPIATDIIRSAGQIHILDTHRNGRNFFPFRNEA